MPLSLPHPSGSGFRVPYPNPLAARLLSLSAALGLSGWVLVVPSQFSGLGHGLLSLLMLGLAAGFIHGVGFVPRLTPWRLLFHPLLAWSAMAVGTALALATPVG